MEHEQLLFHSDDCPLTCFSIKQQLAVLKLEKCYYLDIYYMNNKEGSSEVKLFCDFF